jgi:hypothetical protein
MHLARGIPSATLTPLSQSLLMPYAIGDGSRARGGLVSRIPPLDRDSAAPEAWPLFDRDAVRYGQPLNTTRIAAYRPEIAVAAGRLGQAVAKSGLIDDQLRLLINVRIAGLVGCPF